MEGAEGASEVGRAAAGSVPPQLSPGPDPLQLLPPPHPASDTGAGSLLKEAGTEGLGRASLQLSSESAPQSVGGSVQVEVSLSRVETPLPAAEAVDDAWVALALELAGAETFSQE